MSSDLTRAAADPSSLSSKSQLKREAQALRAFGAQLVALKAAQLAKLPLDERLQRAILEAQRLTPQAARRQLNYIGKLLRATEIVPLQQAVAQLLGGRSKLPRSPGAISRSAALPAKGVSAKLASAKSDCAVK